MLDENDILRVIKQAAYDANQAAYPVEILTGKVLSTAPLEIMVEQKLTLTAIAQQCGFYDQAHFIHDFREICNVTPQQYQKQLQDYYNESFKF